MNLSEPDAIKCKKFEKINIMASEIIILIQPMSFLVDF